ncbi:MAG: hypothetical protein WCJ84_01890 [Candidatus Peregrinibacteria bacterium]
MNTFFLSFGLFSLIFGIVLRFLSGKNMPKYWPNTLRRVKTPFFWIGIAGIILGWFFVEDAFLNALPILWSIHLLSFLGLLAYSIRYFLQEKNRITGAERRRIEKERLKK